MHLDFHSPDRGDGIFADTSLQPKQSAGSEISRAPLHGPAGISKTQSFVEGAARQKLGAACTNSSPASICPRSDRINRATRQSRSSSVCMLVRINSCWRATPAEIGTSPPRALTLIVSVGSKKGSSPTRPYTSTGIVIGNRCARRWSCQEPEMCLCPSRPERLPRRPKNPETKSPKPTRTPN